jgi:hypothetical protein
MIIKLESQFDMLSQDREEEPQITGNTTDGEETTPHGRSNSPPSSSSQELSKSTLALILMYNCSRMLFE